MIITEEEFQSKSKFLEVNQIIKLRNIKSNIEEDLNGF